MPCPYHHCAVADSKEVGELAAFVALVALRLSDAFSGVFQDARTIGDVVQGEASGGMNVRGANNEARQVVVLPGCVGGSIAYRRRAAVATEGDFREAI